MLRISKLADYGMVIMNTLALEPTRLHCTKDIAQSVCLSLPTVSKVLKTLVKAGLVESERGSGGGYCLAKKPSEISVSDVITAIEGIPALTECAVSEDLCSQESVCSVKNNWLLVNNVILKALKSITLDDMTHSISEHPVVLHGIKLNNEINNAEK